MTTQPHYIKSYNLEDPYVVAGRKTYLIGTQDGRFPDMGGHIQHEMGGLWSHPIKVLDGFWLGIGTEPDNVEWLPRAEAFHTTPLAAKHVYRMSGGRRVDQETWAPHKEEGLVISYRFQHFDAHPDTKGSRTLPVVMLFRTDLQGVWLSDRLGWKDGQDLAYHHPDEGFVHAKDGEMPFHLVVGPSNPSHIRDCVIDANYWGPEKTAGRGVSIAFFLSLPIDEKGFADVFFAITSSSQTYEEALDGWKRIRSNLHGLRAEKKEALSRILSYSQLKVPDPDIQGVFDDIKVGYEQLYREVDGFGAGLGAGLPEYPWWFGCDNSYALLGALCVGRFDMTIKTLRLLAKVSQETNGNGRIIHEVSTNGVVYNPGNTQETPHFTMAVWDTFLWTGDLEFLKDMYPLCREGVLSWLLGEQDTDGDLFPEGYGITEVAGLNWELIDTAVYTQQALESLAQMARILEDEQTEEKASHLAQVLKEKIEARYWLEEEGLYADLIAPPSLLLDRLNHIRRQENYLGGEMDKALDDYEELCRTADPDTELPWLFKTWVIFCPLETGLTSQERAERVLDRMHTPEFTGRYGIYLSGFNHLHMMTISSGVGAVAAARYGRVETALGYIRQITNTRLLRFPGAPSEMSPDYGCFVQAWTGYSVAVPIIRHVLGLNPNAHQRRLTLSPRLPASWDHFSLKNMRVGDLHLDFDLRWDIDQSTLEVQVDGLADGWQLELSLDPMWYGMGPNVSADVNGEKTIQTGYQPSVSTPDAAGQNVSVMYTSPSTTKAIIRFEPTEALK